jgi:hypothetical protein
MTKRLLLLAALVAIFMLPAAHAGDYPWVWSTSSPPDNPVRSKYSNVLKRWVDGARRSEGPWEDVTHQFWTV